MSKHEAEKHDDRHDDKEKHGNSAEKHHEKSVSQHEAGTQSDDPVVTPFLLSLSERQAILDKAVKAITRGGPMIAQWKKLVVQVQQVRNEQT